MDAGGVNMLLVLRPCLGDAGGRYVNLCREDLCED